MRIQSFVFLITATVAVNLAVADSFDPRPDGEVHAFALQPDGRIVVGGTFSNLDAQSCITLGRLNADGTIDTNFNAGTDGSVSCLALQGDGKILVGGQFNTLAGQSCTNLGRLNADGTIDTHFNSGADGQVSCLMLQPDGKILVGGGFTSLNGQPCVALGRLASDGTLDTHFNAGADGQVNCLALQADGKIVAGGQFDMLGSQGCANLGRVNADGTRDANFNSSVNGTANCLALQPDGKIVVGGQFNSLGGYPWANLGRVNPDGVIDTDFSSGTDDSVTCLALQADGKVLVGGQFASLSGQSCTNLGRLKGDGTLDSGFQPVTAADAVVNALGLQADGSVLVGRSSGWVADEYRPDLSRLANTDPATQSLSVTGTTITWLRGGTAPEVGAVAFDYSAGGISWTNLGAGLPAAGGGWQLSRVSLPLSGRLRARGQVTGGVNDGSAWFVETIIIGPTISAGPAGPVKVGTGESASFSVTADGSAPLSYQWLRNGTAMGGATNSVYSIASMRGTDAGSYTVVVHNPYGSITSSPPAVLVWAHPEVFITSGPDAGARLIDPTVQLGGAATDNIELTSVEWQLSNAAGTSAWRPAGGITDWTATIPNLALGLNTIAFRAHDVLGYISDEVSRSYLLLTPLTVTVSGYGTLADPNDLGVTFREALRNYALTAVAGSGFTFTNWTGSLTAKTARLNFAMQPGFALQANFVPVDTNPAPWLAITSHTNMQPVSGTTAILAGIAYDWGHGDHGITNVMVNKLRATNDVAVGTNIAYWTKSVPIAGGLNTFTVVAKDRDGYARTNVILLARDMAAPTITIATPKANQSSSNAVLTASGTAKDDVQVDSVWYQLNANDWSQASGTTNWTARLDLLPRTNTFRAYALDTSGRTSATNLVTFNYIVSDRLNLSVTGKGTLSPNYSNAMLEIGRACTITATPATGFALANWTGGVPPYSDVLTNGRTLRFVMQSNLVLQANFLDVAKPTLVVQSPTANQQCSNALFTIKGTASDNMQVAGVQYNLNSSGWQLADGTNNWSKNVSLAKGTNVLAVFAEDTTGNRSPTNKVTFVYNRFLALKATYNGLFSPTNDPAATNSGAITLTVDGTVKGGFSGTLSLQGTNLPFTGAFSQDLLAQVNVVRPKKSPLALALQINPVWTNADAGLLQSNVVTGTMADSTNWTSDVLAFRAFIGKTNAYAGSYTLLIEGDDSPAISPPGDGAATVVVAASGAVTVKGALADSTPFTAGTAISAEGLWPMFASLYTGRGLIIGWMACDTNQPVAGTNLWLKPAQVPGSRINPDGFVAMPVVLLSKCTPPAPGHSAVNWTNGRIVLEFGDLAQPLTNYVVVSNGVFRLVGGMISNLTFSVTNSSGTFGGSFKHPATNAPVKFFGVLVPAAAGADAFGGGWFTGPSQGGRVRLESAEGEWAPGALAGKTVQALAGALPMRQGFGASTFSVHDAYHGMGNYSWQKLGPATGRCVFNYTVPPQLTGSQDVTDVQFTRADAGTFASYRGGVWYSGGTFSALDQAWVTPAALAGKTVQIGLDGGGVMFALSSAGTFIQVDPPSLVAAGKWTYAPYSPIGGTLRLSFTSPSSMSGVTDYVECTFQTPAQGNCIISVYIPGQPKQEGAGSFTVSP